MPDFAATLISPPGNAPLLRAALADLCGLLPSPSIAWLGEDEAADVTFASDDADIGTALRDAVAGRAVDLVVQPAVHRRKRLLVADMDSTMIAQECIDELADHVGFRSEVADLTERAMRGEIAFEPALHERAALLAGLPVDVVDTILSERITATPGARTLVATMQAGGATAVLVSGGFTDFAGPVGAMIGFDAVRANRLVVRDGRFTGEVLRPVLGPQAKREALVAEAARLRIDPVATLAVGDGANDIPMVETAGLGVAFRARPRLAAVADARIDHADLTALLYIQGYRRAEFVEE